MIWIFLNVAEVEVLHTQQIVRFGGSPGLRDRGLLESAVMRAENKVNFDSGATVPTVAASLSYGLIKNHAFIDGNKRVGLASLVAFLRVNGFSLPVPQNEQVAVVQKVAASEMDEAEWTAWVERVVAPLRP